MLHLYRLRACYALLGVAAAIGTTHAAMADDDKRSQRVPLLPQYQQECAACHTAYPPGMLPAASWQRLMNNLPRHYGTDASLEPATAREISGWLAANAASHKRAHQQPPGDRITRSTWFIREHDEVSAATWKLPAVKSPANCAACHTRSDQGDFNEHNIRIPR
jgi:mono/diheme cytochrome c family protein